MTDYAFGDSSPAVERLDVIARVFDGPFRDLVTTFAPRSPAVALDLGCGPGNTTRTVAHATHADRVIGVDASDAFVSLARQRHPDLEFVVSDVTATPLPGAPAEVIACRYLLAHLPEPAAVIDRWRTQLRPRGRIMVEEPHAIDLPEESLRRYLAHAEALVEAAGSPMYPGDQLDGARPEHREVVTHNVSVRDAARMFSLNYSIWGDDEALARELDALARAGTGTCTWHLYQAVFAADS